MCGVSMCSREASLRTCFPLILLDVRFLSAGKSLANRKFRMVPVANTRFETQHEKGIVASVRVKVVDNLGPRNISRQSALKLELSGWYEFRGRRELHRLASRRVITAPPAALHIPEKLPPAELPNIHFEEPQTERWQREHVLPRNMPRFYANSTSKAV